MRCVNRRRLLVGLEQQQHSHHDGGDCDGDQRPGDEEAEHSFPTHAVTLASPVVIAARRPMCSAPCRSRIHEIDDHRLLILLCNPSPLIGGPGQA
jgi:hypothetical protein